MSIRIAVVAARVAADGWIRRAPALIRHSLVAPELAVQR
jgi:hypothetical protein